jgi:hypothetical protein
MQINKGIQLPSLDVELLTLGKLIAIPFKAFVREGDTFWLYPSRQLPENMDCADYYKPEYLDLARTAISSCLELPVQIKAWGRCEKYWRINIDRKNILPQISESNIWNLKALEYFVDQHQCLKLLILRVYWLSQPCTINSLPGYSNFYFPKPEDIVTDANDTDIPVVSSSSFEQRQSSLLSGQVSHTSELEKLYFQISETKKKEDLDSELDRDLRNFLCWSVDSTPKNKDPDLDWIQKIAVVGNSSDGHNFEKNVRCSLIKLGFRNSKTDPKISLDPDTTGGAGGLDFYCESPYPVVGECKATKTDKVPDGTPAQLVKLGQKHLQNHYHTCIKIIMAAGELTKDAEQTARGNKMNVIRPETLQRLVELKAQYPGSIDLLKLKPCLEREPFGSDADRKVNEYIDRIERKIKVRSHLIDLVKKMNREVGVEYLKGAYDNSHPPKFLSHRDMNEILIELSSPLTGYLGRKKGQDWNEDKFYFLRDL